jgi:hypothetical protein
MSKSTLVAAALLVGLGVAARGMAPEVQRYMKIRQM